MKRLVKKHKRKIIYTAPVLFFVMLAYNAVVNPAKIQPKMTIELVPSSVEGYEGDPLTVEVNIETDTPVNAIEASFSYPKDLLEVASISSTSSAVDLWAKEPSFFNDIGAITLSGGMLKTGGFVKQGRLITVSFKTKQSGTAKIMVKEAVFALADGKGTLVTPETKEISYEINEKPVESPDLNDNGKIDLPDLGVWFLQLFRPYNAKVDLNGDKKINLEDAFFFFP